MGARQTGRTSQAYLLHHHLKVSAIREPSGAIASPPTQAQCSYSNHLKTEGLFVRESGEHGEGELVRCHVFQS